MNDPRTILAAVVARAHEHHESVALIRSRTLARVASLIEWNTCGLYVIPTYRGFPLKISEDLYA